MTSALQEYPLADYTTAEELEEGEEEWREEKQSVQLVGKENKELEDDQFVKDVLKLAQQTKGFCNYGFIDDILFYWCRVLGKPLFKFC